MKFSLFIPAIALFGISFSLRKPFVPPGTVRINEHFFADETEVSNLSWMEFVYWTERKYGVNSPEYRATLPDTTVWLDRNFYNAPYAAYYLRHKAYRDFPVVGITHAQAELFCSWRSERVKEFWELKYKTSLHLVYRLPSKEEWEYLSNNGSCLGLGGGKKNAEQRIMNCYDPLDTLYKADVLEPVISFRRNCFGLYNSLGNVAEMVTEPGISKGGSWRHPVDMCRAGIDIPYSKAESWLGFRCVCVVE